MELNITEFIKKETNLKDGNKLQEFTERELNILIYKALKEQLILSGVSKSFKTELEMHEIATEKYQEHNYGDAKYDGFMECYRMLVKETKNKTSLSK